MDLHFEELTDRDLPEIKRIYDWYIKNSTATFHTDPISLDELKEFIFIGHSLYKSYIIRADGQVVGYCYLTNHKKRQAYNRTAEITIYLAPQCCGKGIGRTALHFLEQKAIEVGLKNLIGVISGDNTGSIAVFEKSGFVKCAHYKNIGEKFNKILDVVSFQKEI
jgi:phosphinothricin acetyltransferase